MKQLNHARTEIRKKHSSIHRKNLARRADLLRCVRGFFAEGGYLEVETPVRIPVPLPEAHIEVIAADGWVLQPSPEICMKRLLAAGYEKIFQICKCFRKAERGRRHLPEMTMLEWYAVGETYLDLMTRCEELVLHIAQGLGAGRSILLPGLDDRRYTALGKAHRGRRVHALWVARHGGSTRPGPLRCGHGVGDRAAARAGTARVPV